VLPAAKKGLKGSRVGHFGLVNADSSKSLTYVTSIIDWASRSLLDVLKLYIKRAGDTRILFQMSFYTGARDIMMERAVKMLSIGVYVHATPNRKKGAALTDADANRSSRG
jgi:hypothetical protein